MYISEGDHFFLHQFCCANFMRTMLQIMCKWWLKLWVCVQLCFCDYKIFAQYKNENGFFFLLSHREISIPCVSNNANICSSSSRSRSNNNRVEHFNECSRAHSLVHSIVRSFVHLRWQIEKSSHCRVIITTATHLIALMELATVVVR